MKKLHYLSMVALMAAASIFGTACTDDDYDLDNVGDDLVVKTSVAFPLGHANFKFKDIFDMENARGKFITTNDVVLDLASEDSKEYTKLLPLDIKQTINAQANTIIDNLDMSEIFGEGNAINSIDSLYLMLDVKSTAPFDINVGLKFTDDVKPSVESLPIATIKEQTASLEAPATAGSITTKNVEFGYGSLAESFKKATAIIIPIDLNIPAGKDLVGIDKEQYIDITIKIYVKGTFKTSSL